MSRSPASDSCSSGSPSPRPPGSNRRSFLRAVGGAAGAMAVSTSLTPRLWARLRRQSQLAEGLDAKAVATDEAFWLPVQDAYPVDRSLLNLNNGGVSPSPRQAQQALRRMQDFANQCPSRNLWRIQEPQRETVRQDLAELFGANAEEIAICRNATEALETVTFGLDLKPGDVVLSTNQDYPRMIHAWNQRAQREGIEFRQISLPTPSTAEQTVEAFARAITPQTKVLHFCHVINLTGQILPVRELCDLARSRGCLSLVDGAHAFGHLDFRGTDLGCDFYGTSLHKWMSAPFGTGMLYVRKEHIESVWPLFAHEHPRSEDIRKFEQIGTHPCPLVLSIAEAIKLHRQIGPARKEARLRSLRDHWAGPLSREPGIRFHTALESESSCGFATIEVPGIEAADLASHLWQKHRIVVSPIRHEEFQGIRVSSHVYTLRPELDRFVRAMQEVAREGLPA